MKDYEMVYVSSVGSPQAGNCCLTVSSGKVGLFPAVLEILGYPKRIAFHRGIRSNAGKVVVEAAEDIPGAILVNYDRKKICFYSREILDPLQELVQTNAHGEFVPGIFYTVKGVAAGENTVEFDF